MASNDYDSLCDLHSGRLFPAAAMHDCLTEFLHCLRKTEEWSKTQLKQDYLRCECEALEERLIFCIDEVNATIRRLS